jgi:hypothetical protein
MTTRERNLDFGLIGLQWWGTITCTLPVVQGRQIFLSCTAERRYPGDVSLFREGKWCVPRYVQRDRPYETVSLMYRQC